MKPHNEAGIGILVIPPSQRNNDYDAEVYVVLAINAEDNIRISRRDLGKITTGIRGAVLRSLRNFSLSKSSESRLDSAVLYEFTPINSGNGIRVTYWHLSSGKSAYVLANKVNGTLEIKVGIPPCNCPIQTKFSRKENVNFNHLNHLIQESICSCSKGRSDKFLSSLIVKGLYVLLLMLIWNNLYDELCKNLKKIIFKLSPFTASS